MKKLFFIPLLLATVLVQSCLDVNAPLSEQSPEEMSVKAYVGPQTKDPIDGTTLPADRTLKMSAYWNAPTGRGTSANYFSNVTFSEDASGTNKWRGGTKSGSTFTSAPRYWPQTGTLDLFAYSANGLACGAVNGTQTYKAKVADGVTLSIEDNNTTQTDILFGRVAAATRVDGGNAMTLRHAQALLVWTAESTVAYNATTNYGITLNAIKLEEAYFSGTLAIDGTAAAGSNCTWSSLGNKAASRTLQTTDAAATKIPYNVPATAVAVTTSGWHLGLGGKGIMVPEQAATRFYVEYTIHNGKDDAGVNIDNNVTALYTCSGTWDEGKKYIYKIHFNQNEIIVTPTVTDWANQTVTTANIPQS